jgi:hypothetical protein
MTAAERTQHHADAERDAVEEAVRSARLDEVILSTLPHGLSRWLHVDLPRRIGALELPLTTITPSARRPAVRRPAETVS